MLRGHVSGLRGQIQGLREQISGPRGQIPGYRTLSTLGPLLKNKEEDWALNPELGCSEMMKTASTFIIGDFYYGLDL